MIRRQCDAGLPLGLCASLDFLDTSLRLVFRYIVRPLSFPSFLMTTLAFLPRHVLLLSRRTRFNGLDFTFLGHRSLAKLHDTMKWWHHPWYVSAVQAEIMKKT